MSREMKDSGIAWIGEIPADWEIAKMKYFSHIGSGEPIPSNFYVDNSNIPIYGGGNILGYSTKSNNKNHLILGRVGGDGSVKYIKNEFWATDNSLLIDTSLDKIFLCNLLNCADLLRLNSSTAQPLLTATKIKNIKIVIPSRIEQKAIAEFLDRKCGEIDELIALQDRMIAELKAYKQSVITEAVTRGLNPDAPLRDSGIEWLGDIPEHWESCRIKDVLESSNNGIKIGPFGSSLTGKVAADLPYKVYGQWNIVGKDFNIGKNTVSEETFIELKTYEVIPDDILISMMGTIGKCSIIPKNIQIGIMDSHVVKIRLNFSKIYPKYFEYYYDKDNSNIIFSELKLKKKGSIMDGLNSSILKNLVMIVPPLSEQQEIADFLDRKCEEIDSLIALKQKKIDQLKEYKKSLIYEYVTGKKQLETNEI